MFSTSTHKSNMRNNSSRGDFCARTFDNIVIFVGHALVVCLIFVDVLALRRLIVQPRTEQAVFLAA